MKALFFVAPDFVYWPIAFMRELEKKEPGSSFSAFAVAPQSTIDLLRQQKDLSINPIFSFDALTFEWLKTPYKEEDIQTYEKLLGVNVINQLIVADRLIGGEYVTGGFLHDTPLRQMARTRDNQLRMILGLLNTLYQHLKTERPDIVFSPGVAGAPALAIALLCKALDIPFRVLTETRFKKKYVLDSCPYRSCHELGELYQDVVHQKVNLPEPCIEQAKAELDEFRNKPEMPEYWHFWRKIMGKPPRLNDLLALVYRAITGRELEAISYPYHMNRFKFEISRYLKLRKYLKKYERLSKDSLDLNQPYIYYPLHVDPEASTMVKTYFYTDQLNVIEMLSKSLPPNMYLYVKEHIPMLGRRPKGFYERIQSYPNVKLVSPLLSSFDLIKQSKTVAVITGTAAFEAFMLGKVPVCLGPIHFQHIGYGYVKCENLLNLPSCIRQALSAEPVKDEDLIRFLACIITMGFDCDSKFLGGIGVDEKMVQENAWFVEKVVEQLLAVVSQQESVNA